SIFDFTFEDYKAAGLNIAEQHSLIGKIREEVPIIERDEVDGLLLSQAAKQLEMCIFPMCNMMRIDPNAIKRMLDSEFKKAYGEDAEQEKEIEMSVEMDEPKQQEMQDMHVGDVGMEVKREESMAATGVMETSVFDDQFRVGSEPALADETPSKKQKKGKANAMQTAIKAYQTRRKKGRKGFRILTLRSKAVVEKWAELE
ncbi:hypothetical protein EK21DRAFT_21123, partial [Setomelanomma holmii]